VMQDPAMEEEAMELNKALQDEVLFFTLLGLRTRSVRQPARPSNLGYPLGASHTSRKPHTFAQELTQRCRDAAPPTPV
jgi:hypothetical protein